MNPIIYFELSNNRCSCNSNNWWGSIPESYRKFINPRITGKTLTCNLVSGSYCGKETFTRTLDCMMDNYYDYVNFIIRFYDGTEKVFNIRDKKQLCDCIEFLEQYTNNGNGLSLNIIELYDGCNNDCLEI